MLSYYDREGQPIDALRWGKLSEDTGYRFVARDGVRAYDLHGGKLAPDYSAFVVTIWIGFDAYGLDPTSRLIFESTVFCPLSEGMGIALEPNGERKWIADDRYKPRQYATVAEALRGHFDLLDCVRQRLATEALRSYERERGVV